MPDHDYVILSVRVWEIEGSVHVAFQTNNTNAQDTIVTTLFRYDVQHNLWSTKRMGISDLLKYTNQCTIVGSIHNRDSKIVCSQWLLWQININSKTMIRR